MKNSNFVELSALEAMTDEQAGRVTGGCELVSAVFVGLVIGVGYGIWYFTKGPGSNAAPAPAPENTSSDFTLQDLEPR